MIRRLSSFVALAALSLAGCGTMANFGFAPCPKGPQYEIYGGVTRDFDLIENHYGGPMYFPYLVFNIVDVPLSLAGDTVTLPITIPATIWRSRWVPVSVPCEPSGLPPCPPPPPPPKLLP